MTTQQLIRNEIDRLHKRNSGDWQSLIRSVNDHYRPINLNTSQWIALNLPPTVKNVDLEWSRGTGKTTITAAFTRRVAINLPRGVFQWEVPTYQKILTEIMPSYIHALEMQGLYNGLHYFIGRKPPAAWRWPEAYKPPKSYDRFISFWNGFGITLISQDIPGAGRGLNTDGRFADECVMLNKQRLDEESGPSIRGSNVSKLADNRYFDFRLMCSSTALTPEGAWFVDREKDAMTAPHLHRFIRANCVENIHLGWLKKDYLVEGRRQTADETTFEAEYLNIRPQFARNGFYGLLRGEKHGYTDFDYTQYANRIGAQPLCLGDADRVPNIPLSLGMDFGAAINCIVVGQYLPAANEMRILKSLWSKGREGKTQDDVCEEFCQYYAAHPVREVELWYDATGNHATGNTKLSRAQQAEQYLTARGWKVRRMTIAGTNPHHQEKHFLYQMLLAEDTHLPRLRLNMQNARDLYVSMSRAGVVYGRNKEIKKNKSGERVDNPQRQYATDLSDALDSIIFGKFVHLSKSFGRPLV